MKTIVITTNRYINGQDLIVEIIYRGTSWEVSNNNNETVLNILNGKEVIATHRSWDNVKFSEAFVQEKEAD